MLQKNWSELIKPTKMEVNVEESNGKVGVLTAEPLERGFGLTLGNSIRRILLSSLQGAAITSVKIKGVVHEFSTISGVKEDLTDILLNLKSIAVKVHSPGLKKMYLKSTGSGELRAGNFETDSETEAGTGTPNLEHATGDMTRWNGFKHNAAQATNIPTQTHKQSCT